MQGLWKPFGVPWGFGALKALGVPGGPAVLAGVLVGPSTIAPPD
jgi:hypothetical protein